MTPSVESLILLALHSGPSFINQQKDLSRKQTWSHDSKTHQSPVPTYSYGSPPSTFTLHHSLPGEMACCFLKHQTLSQSCTFFGLKSPLQPPRNSFQSLRTRLNSSSYIKPSSALPTKPVLLWLLKVLPWTVIESLHEVIEGDLGQDLNSRLRWSKELSGLGLSFVCKCLLLPWKSIYSAFADCTMRKYSLFVVFDW